MRRHVAMLPEKTKQLKKARAKFAKQASQLRSQAADLDVSVKALAAAEGKATKAAAAAEGRFAKALAAADAAEATAAAKSAAVLVGAAEDRARNAEAALVGERHTTARLVEVLSRPLATYPPPVSTSMDGLIKISTDCSCKTRRGELSSRRVPCCCDPVLI